MVYYKFIALKSELQNDLHLKLSILEKMFIDDTLPKDFS